MPYFIKCYLNAAYRLLYTRLKGEKVNPGIIAGKNVLNIVEANDYIYNSLLSGIPFMAARYGSVELGVMVKYITKQFGFIHEIPNKHMKVLCYNAGFFPNKKEDAEIFAKLMLELSQQVDLLGAWNDILEDYVIKEYAPQTQITYLYALYPYNCKRPWMAALEGKKVLVIHPFEETIQQQYVKRGLLFENPLILPKFELKTIKAVQTIAGNKSEFTSWFEALDYMLGKALDIDFDIALIGCGAYGFPLAANLKKMGKQAIHLGGWLQYLFGIMSTRSDLDPKMSKLYNEYWVRPNSEERPKDFQTIEGGCYW